MLKNTMKEKLIDGEPAFGIRIVETKSTGILDIIKESGMDWVWIDCEHGSYDMETVLTLSRYSNAIGLCPIIKIPTLAYHLISRPLDQLAMGLVVPLIETEEQAKDSVKFTRYPPEGERGCGLDNDYFKWKRGTSEYLNWANENILLILQIESKKAIDNIELISQVKGVDALLVGPLDLSISLGVPGEVNHPFVIDAIQKIADACEKSGLIFGYPGTADNAATWYQKGARLLCLGSDTTIFAEGCRDKIKSYQSKIMKE